MKKFKKNTTHKNIRFFLFRIHFPIERIGTAFFLPFCPKVVYLFNRSSELQKYLLKTSLN